MFKILIVCSVAVVAVLCDVKHIDHYSSHDGFNEYPSEQNYNRRMHLRPRSDDGYKYQTPSTASPNGNGYEYTPPTTTTTTKTTTTTTKKPSIEYLPPTKPTTRPPPTQPPTSPPPTQTPTRPPQTYLPPVEQEENHEHEPGMPFDFKYEVKDPESSNDFSHQASSDGDVTRGEYRVQLPDGRTQVVRYTADWKNGYNAVVSYE